MAPLIKHGFRLLKLFKVRKSKLMEGTHPFATDNENGQKTKNNFPNCQTRVEFVYV